MKYLKELNYYIPTTLDLIILNHLDLAHIFSSTK